MPLLSTRDYYKPFQYPWAHEAFKKQNQMHWLPETVALNDDVKDWNSKLDASEKNLLTQLFRFFTQADVDVAKGYTQKFLPLFGGNPEIAMMMSSFANMEAVHMHAYSLLLDTVGMPETEYQAFAQYKEMSDKHEFFDCFSTNPDKPESIALSLAAYSAFTEGLQLFSSFAILLNFSRFNKMKGMSQIVTWSVRDETLHVESMIRLFREFIKEENISKERLEDTIYDICLRSVILEDNFIDLAFEQGGIQGLTADEVKKYIRYIANLRLQQLGFNPLYVIDDNPLPWLEWVLNGTEHQNFFEGRATDYAKATIQDDWGEAF